MCQHKTLLQPENVNETMDLLRVGCQRWDIPLSEEQITQFESYYHALAEWNQKFNLTSITEYTEVQTKHFLDSLAALPLIAEELHLTLPLSTPLDVIDVGSGAGFPGVPLKIAAPTFQLTLLDGTSKKIRFLQHLVDVLMLDKVAIVQGRAEELGRQSAYREQYDIVTGRAVAPLNTLVEYLLPLTRLGGLVIIYKGGGAADEFMAARKAIDILGGETVRFAPVEVPFLEQKRFVLLLKKVKHTPGLYPRGQGLARKKPVG
ncbi:MAG: 16S rRNA (guanine(527)-N(7))-methyltransferase RsmG [Caldilineaceae bacterium]